MVFETHDVLKYLTDMETNLNIGKSTIRSPLHELFTNNDNIQENQRLHNRLYNIDQIYSRPIMETMETMDSNCKYHNLIQSTNEYTNLPDHLKMIVNKTWKAYLYQENHENINPNRMKTSSSTGSLSLSSTSAICTCQSNMLMNDSIYFPICSTTRHNSILGTDQLLKKRTDSKNQYHESIQLHKQQLSIEKLTKLQPRPLLRQKETDEHYITTLTNQLNNNNNNNNNSIIIASKTCINHNDELQSTIINTHRPMQVHMRYPIPRKQDAIYNARYKTQPCLHYQKYKHCPLGDNCHFAHGPNELKYPQFHPKYRTRICINYANNGHCPFGSNCYFLHFTPPPPLAAAAAGTATTTTTMTTTTAAATTTTTENHNLNRIATSFWDIDHFIQDDRTIISSNNSSSSTNSINHNNSNSHMDTMTLCSNLRRVTI
ncbi:unnamed protein product [Schistosoma spindalis]|nr:unnamed protein product [Schistosoma spindale]